jgi:hypothetical protein
MPRRGSRDSAVATPLGHPVPGQLGRAARVTQGRRRNPRQAKSRGVDEILTTAHARSRTPAPRPRPVDRDRRTARRGVGGDHEARPHPARDGRHYPRVGDDARQRASLLQRCSEARLRGGRGARGGSAAPVCAHVRLHRAAGPRTRCSAGSCPRARRWSTRSPAPVGSQFKAHLPDGATIVLPD